MLWRTPAATRSSEADTAGASGMRFAAAASANDAPASSCTTPS